MKTGFLKLAAIAIAMTPLFVSAQTNVKKAFDNLLKSSDVVYSENHTLQKDVTTGIKESQADIYAFTLPAKKINLIDNIVKAFKDDENDAYTISSGDAGKNDSPISLAVGNGDGSGVRINPAGRHYVYGCYLAPKKENPSGNYRYAYALNWVKKNDIIEGTLVITYATTLKYRQASNDYYTTTYDNNNNNNNNIIINTTKIQSSDSWFTTLVSYLQAMSASDVQSRQIVAAKIYKHVQQVQTNKNISKEDKETARELLKAVELSQSKGDKIAQQLINSALIILK